MNPSWQDLTPTQRAEIIAPLWAEGKSASRIAAEHFQNATKNMIIGVVAKERYGRKPKPPAVPKAKPVKMPKPAPVMAPETEDNATIRHLIANNRPPLPDTVPVSLLDLPYAERGVACRMPVQGGYCGQDVGGDEHRYCPTHRKLMYRQTAPGKETR